MSIITNFKSNWNNKVYTLMTDDYSEAFRLMRKLYKRKQNVFLRRAIFIVEVDDHRKLNKLPGELLRSGVIFILGDNGNHE